MNNEIYVSVDIESDGPIPGRNNMLSVGAAALTSNKELVGTFNKNLELLDEATPDPDTMDNFWAKNPDAWDACRSNLEHPTVAMPKMAIWLRNLGGKPVFVGYPASFDFMFVVWYLNAFAGDNPFSFQALDMKSYWMATAKNPTFKQTVKKNMPKLLFDKGIPHNHIAICDALQQGVQFINMLRYNQGFDPVNIELTNLTRYSLDDILTGSVACTRK